MLVNLAAHVARLDKNDDGSMVVTLKYPHYLPIMKLCTVMAVPHIPSISRWQADATRQLLETAYNSRCVAENTPILEEMIALRHQKAQVRSI